MVYGGESRDILNFSAYDYEVGGSATSLENTFITRLAPEASLLLRYYRYDADKWSNNIYTFGPVLNLDKYHYLEITYGYGIDSNDSRADYYNLEITRERPEYMAGAGLRHGDYAGGYYYDLLSGYVKYPVTQELSLLGKLFLSYDSDGNSDYSLWGEGEYRFSPEFKGSLGLTSGDRLYSVDYGPQGGGDFYSWQAGFSYQAGPKALFKYRYENTIRQSEFSDTRHDLVLDIRF